MTLDEAIKHIEKVVEENQKIVDTGYLYDNITVDMLYGDDTEAIKGHLDSYQICADRHRELAEWLKELKRFKEKRGEWLRMSDLSQQDDDRYKCSRCGNVVHYKNKMDLYTFNSWCGRCGSDNTNSTPIYGYFMSESEDKYDG